jgi:hypothetical protein
MGKIDTNLLESPKIKKGDNIFLISIYSLFTIMIFVNKFSIIDYNFEVVLFLAILVFAVSYDSNVYLSAIFFGISLNAFLGASFLILLPNYLIITQIVIFIIAISKRELNFKVTTKFKLFIIYFFYALIVGFIFIQNPMQLISFNQNYLIILTSILIIVLIDKSDGKKYLENSLLSAIVLGSLFYITLNLLGFSMERDANGFTLPDRNYMSLFMSFGIAIIMGQFFDLNFFQKNIYTGLMTIIIIAQLLIASRGGLITTVVIVSYTFLTRGDLKGKGGLILITGLIFFFIFKYASDFEIFERFGDDTLETGGGRTNIWEDTFDAYSKQDLSLIIWGGGYYHTIFNLSDGWSTHNNYLEQLYDYGIVGFILLFTILIKCFIDGDSTQKLVLIGLLVGFFSLVPLMYIEYWVVIGYLMIYKNES